MNRVLGVVSLLLVAVSAFAWVRELEGSGRPWLVLLLSLLTSLIAGLRGSKWWLIISGSVLAFLLWFVWLLSQGH